MLILNARQNVPVLLLFYDIVTLVCYVCFVVTIHLSIQVVGGTPLLSSTSLREACTLWRGIS